MNTPSKKRALITGISGQDGSYLAELLLEKGYEVMGTTLRPERDTKAFSPDIAAQIQFLPAVGHSQEAWNHLLADIQPNELYHLAGMTFVPNARNEPAKAASEIALPAIRMLQAVRDVSPNTRVFQACSSEMFSRAAPSPQNEDTPLRPASPYGAAKAYTYFCVEQFVDLYGVFATAGILYNHESPRRPPHFVTRKITHSAAKIQAGQLDCLHLGDLEAQRDWGFAGDYVKAMWLMLQKERPASYVLATGVLHSVRDIVNLAFGELGLDVDKYVVCDPNMVRPKEARPLVGDASKAKKELGWQAEMPFETLIRSMVRHDVELLRRENGGT